MNGMVRYLKRIPRTLYRDHPSADAGSKADAHPLYLEGDLLFACREFCEKNALTLSNFLLGIFHLCIQLLENNDESLVWETPTELPGVALPSYIYLDENDCIVDVFAAVSQIDDLKSALVVDPGIMDMLSNIRKDSAKYVYVAAQASVDSEIQPATCLKLSEDEGRIAINLSSVNPANQASLLLDVLKYAISFSDKQKKFFLQDFKPHLGSEDPSVSSYVIDAVITAVTKSVGLKESADIKSNYFNIGGTSLIAFKVIKEINNRLGIGLTLRELFENPELTNLCAAINKKYLAREKKQLNLSNGG